jgi:hypothetical protein
MYKSTNIYQFCSALFMPYKSHNIKLHCMLFTNTPNVSNIQQWSNSLLHKIVSL